jgi:hypothetical protein
MDFGVDWDFFSITQIWCTDFSHLDDFRLSELHIHPLQPRLIEEFSFLEELTLTRACASF